MMKYSIEGSKLTIFLRGRIDSKNAVETEKELSEVIDSTDHTGLIFDLDELEYISSAGLRVLMKIRKKYGITPVMINASPDVYDIFETTGFTEIFSISRKLREVSVEGCEIIGNGYYGTVYRIDEETIVKVYNASPDTLAMIYNEQSRAKIAFIAGIPTAISYDVVRVGDRYGAVFELLKAKTFNELLIAEPENADDIIRQYAQFMHTTHQTQVPAGKLNSAKKMFMGYLDIDAKYLPSDMVEKLRIMIDEVPETHDLLHGDFQMKNVMLTDGEPMLIDMDTLAEGHPIFDLQSVYVTYFAFGEADKNNSMDFLGIPREVSAMIWDKFVGYYFDTEDEKLISQMRDKIMITGCIRFIFLLHIMGQAGTELFGIRLEQTTRRLEELLKRTDSLLF